jgi:hypothetical protein
MFVVNEHEWDDLARTVANQTMIVRMRGIDVNNNSTDQKKKRTSDDRPE